MKSLRHKHHYHLWMAFLVVVAAFLFQMRQGTWATLLKVNAKTYVSHSHNLHTHNLYSKKPLLSLTQHITLLNSSDHSHNQDLHANHDAHCLFCITQAFSDSPIPFTKLKDGFHISSKHKVIYFVLPLFIASNSDARAPPQ